MTYIRIREFNMLLIDTFQSLVSVTFVSLPFIDILEVLAAPGVVIKK